VKCAFINVNRKYNYDINIIELYSLPMALRRVSGQGRSIFRDLRNNSLFIRLLVSSCLSVCPSFRMEQLGSHGKDFRKILYLRIFRKICQENLSFIKTDKNNAYFTCIPVYVPRLIPRIRNVSEKSW
jgi:hypothetical protein